jgi:predicted nuclease of restriction endonuclease-like (RecB) superfamily
VWKASLIHFREAFLFWAGRNGERGILYLRESFSDRQSWDDRGGGCREIDMKLNDLATTLAQTHDALHRRAGRAVNLSLVARNWLFGYAIVTFEQNGEDRAQYGKRLIESLAQSLNAQGVPGCSATNLKNFRRFYETFPAIGQTLSAQLTGLVPTQKEMTLLTDTFPLGWSQYLILIGIKNTEERAFYEHEARANDWAVRELERQIDSALYERLALSRDKEGIRALAQEGQVLTSPQDTIKNPYVLEFLGLTEQSKYSETDLETALIDKLEHFLLELGKGFLFEARQKRFTLDEDHFYVDLVFYNRLLRCYVLIDLKIEKLTHQDLGQMQMYVNYFDRYVKTETENPTIGIVLCKRKRDTLVELTLPKDANIFASEYELYLPSKEELRRQLEEHQAEK